MQNILFDTGPEGTALSAANTGASLVSRSGGATSVFAAAAAVHGSFGARFTAASGANIARFSTESSSAQQAFSFWFRTSSISPATSAGFFNVRYDAGVVLRMEINSAGRFQVGDVGGPTYTFLGTAGAFAINTWYRFEIIITGGSTSAGAYTVKGYNTAGTQVGTTATSTVANLTANPISNIDVGNQSNAPSGFVFDYDDVRNETGRTIEIGPYTPGVNQPPSVTVSSPATTTTPNNSVPLNAVGTDPDGTITSFVWDFTSLPAGVSAPTVNNGTTNQATFTPTQPGIYIARCTVTDNSSATATASITIYVGGLTANVVSTTLNPGGWTTTPSGTPAATALSDNDATTYVESPAAPPSAATVRYRLAPLQPLTAFSLVLGGVSLNGSGNLTTQVTLYAGTTSRKVWTGIAATGADVTLTLNSTELAAIQTAEWNTLDVEISTVAA